MTLALLVALHLPCSSDPVAVPAVSITASVPRIGHPWFLTYSATSSVTGGSGDAVVWFGTAQEPAALPVPGCTADVAPLLFIPHWFPLRGNIVVAVMPDVPQDPGLVGLQFAVQSFIVCHLPGQPDVFLGTNAVGLTIQD